MCDVKQSREVFFVMTLLQVKPLLQVTNNEEKLNVKAQELRQVAETLDKLRAEHDTLEANHQQIVEEKTVLSEQLRAEQDLCAETEEVMWLFKLPIECTVDN